MVKVWRTISGVVWVVVILWGSGVYGQGCSGDAAGDDGASSVSEAASDAVAEADAAAQIKHDDDAAAAKEDMAEGLSQLEKELGIKAKRGEDDAEKGKATENGDSEKGDDRVGGDKEAVQGAEDNKVAGEAGEDKGNGDGEDAGANKVSDEDKGEETKAAANDEANVANDNETVARDEGAGVSAEVLRLLDRLELRCWTMESFSSGIRYEKEQVLIDSKTVQRGRLYYEVAEKEGQGETVRFMLHFTDLQEFDTMTGEAFPVIRFDEHYAFNGKWMVRRNSRTKSIERWELSKDWANRETFRLGEGPFPLPFAIKREDVLKEFAVSLETETDEQEEQGLVHLRLEPKAGGTFAKQYVVLELWIDETMMVVKKLAFETTDAEISRVWWNDIKVNEPIADEVFELEPGDGDWSETVHPME